MATTVSVKKCFVLNVGNIVPKLHSLHIANNSLPVHTSGTDLGVTITRDLKPCIDAH